MIRIGIAGLPGSGKSATARALSALIGIKTKFKRVELVSEYARRYIAKYGTITGVEDQYRILMKQLDWENSIPVENTDVMITDSPVHTGFLYVIGFKKPTDTTKEAIFTNDIFKKMNMINTPPRYDIVFYLPAILKPVSDGVRHEDHFTDTWRDQAELDLKFVFRMFPPKKLVEIKALDLMERVEECLDYLRDF